MGTHVVVIILISFFIFLWPLKGFAEDIVVKVGDEKITEGDIKKYTDIQTGPQFKGKALSREQLIENLIIERLLYLEAKNKGLDKRKDIKTRIEETVKTILVDTLVEEEIKSKIEVKEEDVEAYYEKNKEKFFNPARYSFQMFRFEKDDSQAEEVKRTLKCIQNKWKERPTWDMDAVADQCITSKEIFVEKLRPVTLPENARGWDAKIFEALSSLKAINEVSDIFETEKHYMILKLTDVHERLYLPLNAVSQSIKAILLKERFPKAVRAYADELKKKYDIEKVKK